MDEERESITNNWTWKICDLPPGANLLTAKWIYKTKVGPDNRSTKLKAHLVARGYQQIEGLGYQEIFALVAKWNSICIVIALVASY